MIFCKNQQPLYMSNSIDNNEPITAQNPIEQTPSQNTSNSQGTDSTTESTNTSKAPQNFPTAKKESEYQAQSESLSCIEQTKLETVPAETLATEGESFTIGEYKAKRESTDPATISTQSTTTPNIEPQGATVLHFNDLHGYLVGNDANDYAGGLPRMTTAIKEKAKENIARNYATVVTIAGDVFNGGIDNDGQMVIDGLRLMKEETESYGVKYVAVVGNHASDHGNEKLVQYIEEVGFEVINANSGIEDNDEGELASTPLANPRATLDIGGNKKISVVGVTTDKDSPNKIKIKNKETRAKRGKETQHLPLTTSDPVAIADQQLKRVAEEKSAATILLTHTGDDYRDSLTKLAKEHKDVLVIDGHTHKTPPPVDEVHSYQTCSTVNGVPYCIAPADPGVPGLGVADIKFNKDQNNQVASGYIPLTPDVKRDNGVVQGIEKLIEEDKAKHPERYIPVGRLLDKNGNRINMLGRSRSEQSELGTFITDAMLDTVEKTRDFNGIPQDQPLVALINSGAMRLDATSDPEGTVLSGQVNRIFPYDNRIVTTSVTGAELKDIIEKSNNRPDGDGDFLQYGGLPETIDDTQTYTVATIDFLLSKYCKTKYFAKNAEYARIQNPEGQSSEDTITIKDVFTSSLAPPFDQEAEQDQNDLRAERAFRKP